MARMHHCTEASTNNGLHSSNQTKKIDLCFVVIIVDYIGACTSHNTGLHDVVGLQLTNVHKFVLDVELFHFLINNLVGLFQFCSWTTGEGRNLHHRPA